MNIKSLLVDSKFKNSDIEKINLFLIDKDIYYLGLQNFNKKSLFTVFINDGKSSFNFVKTENIEQMELFYIENNLKIQYIYFKSSFIPFYSYIEKKGKSKGLGDGSKEIETSSLFQLIGYDENINIYLLYKKNKNEIIILINDLEKKFKNDTNIYYLEEKNIVLEFDLKNKKNITPEIFSEKSFSKDDLKNFRNISQRNIKNYRKYKSHKDIGDVFLDNVDISKLKKFEIMPKDIIEQCSNFISIYKILKI
jgi:hypothetical protein